MPLISNTLVEKEKYLSLLYSVFVHCRVRNAWHPNSRSLKTRQQWRYNMRLWCVYGTIRAKFYMGAMKGKDGNEKFSCKHENSTYITLGHSVVPGWSPSKSFILFVVNIRPSCKTKAEAYQSKNPGCCTYACLRDSSVFSCSLIKSSVLLL